MGRKKEKKNSTKRVNKNERKKKNNIVVGTINVELKNQRIMSKKYMKESA